MYKDDTDKTAGERGPIKVELREDLCGFRLPCTVCDGTTEKFEALAEAEFEGTTIRVCARCLEAGAGQIDERLRQTVTKFENYVAFLRSLVGRLQVPSFEEWQAHDDDLQAEDICAHDGINKQEALQQVRDSRERYLQQVRDSQERHVKPGGRSVSRRTCRHGERRPRRARPRAGQGRAAAVTKQAGPGGSFPSGYLSSESF